MAVTSRHNKYTSIPDWFSGQSTETATTSPISQTVYIGGSSSATIAGSTVDFKDIPIDDSTIVWQNEQLAVPIDNDKIVIVDGKVTTSANASGVWELRQLTDGTNYIYTTYPVVTQLGITMYSGTEGLDIGGIYDGLPIDNTTIYWDIDSNGNKVLKAIGSSSGGGVADSVAWANVVGKPIWLLDDKISYSEIEGTPDLSKYALVSQIPSLEGYALSSDLAKYIPIKDYTEITGEKNFTGGLKVNDSLIYYDTEKKYWKFEGDLLVTGGVTMYGNDSDFVPSTIMDAILYDDTTLGINAQGQLYVKGSVGGATTLGSLTNVGSWADSVASQDRIMYQAANSSQWVAKNLSDLAVGGVTGNYLPLTGGELSGSLAVTAIQNGYWAGGIRIDGTTEKPPSLAFHIANLAGWRLYMDINQKLLWENSSNGQGVTSREILHTSNYSSYALPLSGGTIKSAAVPQLTLQGESTDAYITFKTTLNTADSAHSGLINLPNIGASASFGVFDRIVFPFSGGMYYRNGYNGTNQTIWHAGNDGSGSGLDADLLDGYDSSYIMKYGGNWTASTDTAGIFAFGFGGSSAGLANNYGAGIQLCNAQGITAKPSSSNNNANWYSQLLFGTDNRVYARFNTNGGGWSTQNQIAYVTDNVASATKLQTARTIWGQSFDGTGNIDGDLTANGNITMRTGTAFDASKYLTLTNNASQYGRIGITFNGSTQDSNDNWGEGGRSIISFRRKYGTATSYTFSYAIQHNLVDNTLGILYGSNVGILLNGAGNVGIGTTSPGAKLHVVGDVNVAKPSTANQASLSFMNTSSDLWQISGRFNKNNSAENDRLNFYYYNGTTWSTIVTLYNTGNMLVSGGITMYSDARKKTILNHVELSLQQVADAPLIEHYYNSDQNKTTHVGSIAQYWYGLNDWFCKEDNEGYLTMEIQNCALASAISIARELDKYESKTDKKIRQLKKRISQLEDELETLKNKQ